MNPTPSTTHTVHTSGGGIDRNLSLVRDEISDTTAAVDGQEMADLADLLGQGRRVFVAGAGRSGLVLRMAAMRLMHLDMTVHVAGATTTPAIGPGDLLLVASGSGTTQGVLRSAETAQRVGARIAAFTATPESPLAKLADSLVIIPAAQKTDHGSGLSRQYSGSLFEQVLFLLTEAIFQSLWDSTDEPAEKLWVRHANLE